MGRVQLQRDDRVTERTTLSVSDPKKSDGKRRRILTMDSLAEPVRGEVDCRDSLITSRISNGTLAGVGMGS